MLVSEDVHALLQGVSGKHSEWVHDHVRSEVDQLIKVIVHNFLHYFVNLQVIAFKISDKALPWHVVISVHHWELCIKFAGEHRYGG